MEHEALTIRFPADLLAKARKLKEGSAYYNDLIVEALEGRCDTAGDGLLIKGLFIAPSETLKSKTA